MRTLVIAMFCMAVAVNAAPQPPQWGPTWCDNISNLERRKHRKRNANVISALRVIRERRLANPVTSSA